MSIKLYNKNHMKRMKTRLRKWKKEYRLGISFHHWHGYSNSNIDVVKLLKHYNQVFAKIKSLFLVDLSNKLDFDTVINRIFFIWFSWGTVGFEILLQFYCFKIKKIILCTNLQWMIDHELHQTCDHILLHTKRPIVRTSRAIYFVCSFYRNTCMTIFWGG